MSTPTFMPGSLEIRVDRVRVVSAGVEQLEFDTMVDAACRAVADGFWKVLRDAVGRKTCVFGEPALVVDFGTVPRRQATLAWSDGQRTSVVERADGGFEFIPL